MKKKILELNNIDLSFGDKQIIKDFSLYTVEGEIVSLLGTNGSGKSSLMKIATGLLKADQGEIIINGISMEKDPQKALQQMSAQIEEPVFYEEMTALDNLYLFSSMKGSNKEDADYYLEKFGLTEHKKKKVRKFSIGMRRRLQLAICLSYKADLYILDEPFSGLDYQAVELLENILHKIKERGASMIISSHQSEPLERIEDRSYTMINLNQLK